MEAAGQFYSQLIGQNESSDPAQPQEGQKVQFSKVFAIWGDLVNCTDNCHAGLIRFIILGIPG